MRGFLPSCYAFLYFSNPGYLSVTLDRSLLFETTVVNAIAKVGAKKSPVEKTYLDEVGCLAISIQIDSSRPVAEPILGRLEIEVCWVIFLSETNFLKAFIFLFLAIMKTKSYCFGNQLFSPIFLPIFSQKCLHFMIKVKNFEGSMASVANC